MYKTRITTVAEKNTNYPKFIIRKGSFDDVEIISSSDDTISLTQGDSLVEPVDPVIVPENLLVRLFQSFYGTLGDKSYVIAIEQEPTSVTA